VKVRAYSFRSSRLRTERRFNQKSSASQRQINCAAKSFAARRGILLRDPNRGHADAK
jgi:hypothetical protein